MGHFKSSATQISVFRPTSHTTPPKQQPQTLAASISFCPASHSPEPFREDDGLVVGAGEDPSLALLCAVARKQGQICDELLHSSIPSNLDALRNIIPQRNGFVHTVVEAYNRHRALIVRPDDVWLAILTQFSFFVNGNAEALRSVFVAHEGKKELVIVSPKDDRYTMDPAGMASQMTKLMQEHIIDKSLREWILPRFSTTTATDNATSAIVMMGTMKEYFSYKFCLACGIPRVTLEGEKRDWEDILHRLERLKEYGVQTTAWYHLLRPVLSRFVSAYDGPTSRKNLEFWNKVAHSTGGGSGPRYLSGWITAFCVFDEQGRWQGNTFNERANNAKDPLCLSGPQFASTYLLPGDTPYLALDGFPYPAIDSNDVPCGYVHVDVKLDDNGESFDTMFVAGLIGSCISSTTKTWFSRDGTRDTVRPIPGWWYFIKGKEPDSNPTSRPKGVPPMQSPSAPRTARPFPNPSVERPTLAPSDKFPWRFVDANAFVSSGAIRIVSFEDISDLDFVAISYVWTDGIKKWRDRISSTRGSTYEERIGRGSKMLSTEPADISDGDGVAHAQLFFAIVAFFVMTRGKKFFWIDILCINQDEQREKSFFVPRMGDLYRRAAETHAYPFGAKIPPTLFNDEVYFPVWETRAWTVQEQILSKRVLFCYAVKGDVRQGLKNIGGNTGRSDPERLVDMHTPVLDRYRYTDGIFLLETKGNAITCKMEEESWTTLPTSAWVSEADGSALMRRGRSDMHRGFVQGSAYKVLSQLKKSGMSNAAEAARISMVRIAMGRRSTIPEEDMIYSMLGTFDLGNFRVEYEIGFEEARLRVFEALCPKVLAHIIGTEWGSKSSANNKDSALPRVVGSSPVPCIISLESAIRHCKYTRNVGTRMNCRREKFRVWAADARVRLNQDFLRITLGNDRLLLMQIASIFDTPEVASMPTKTIPRSLTKVMLVEMSTFGVDSDDEASKIDRTAEFVEIGVCDSGAMVVPSLPETMGKSSLLALYCEDTASGALVNKGTVLILDASAFSTEYGDALIE